MENISLINNNNNKPHQQQQQQHQHHNDLDNKQTIKLKSLPLALVDYPDDDSNFLEIDDQSVSLSSLVEAKTNKLLSTEAKMNETYKTIRRDYLSLIVNKPTEKKILFYKLDSTKDIILHKNIKNKYVMINPKSEVSRAINILVLKDNIAVELYCYIKGEHLLDEVKKQYKLYETGLWSLFSNPPFKFEIPLFNEMFEQQKLEFYIKISYKAIMDITSCEIENVVNIDVMLNFKILKEDKTFAPYYDKFIVEDETMTSIDNKFDEKTIKSATGIYHGKITTFCYDKYDSVNVVSPTTEQK